MVEKSKKPLDVQATIGEAKIGVEIAEDGAVNYLLSLGLIIYLLSLGQMVNVRMVNVRMVRIVRTVRRSHCSHGSNCSHCSSFALFEQFTRFAVRTVRYLRKKLLFGANSANKRTANTFVRSSVVPGYRSDLDLIQEGLISRDSFKR